ncbi:MAG: zinc ribbon domain-containing protein [Ignavibacteriales bacterium]|nr:zinc ribbon domain-containing protein [Ignavibacteriales bacterium]
MPTYDYRCKECGHAFEELQSMTAEPLIVCPNCGKPSLKRLMTGGSGMIFKGSGFYLTDYKKTGSETKSTEKPAPSSGQAETKKDSPAPADSAKPKKGDS